jgi:hypothetical protein
VQDTHDEYPVRLWKIKDDVMANLESPQAGFEGIAGSADGGVTSQQFEPIFELAKIPIGLTPSPSLNRVADNLIDIAFGLNRDSVLGQGYASLTGSLCFRRIRANVPGFATPLAIPFSIAARKPAIFSSSSRSSRSRSRKAARITSLALA